jgi:acetyl-CoA carboxylase carboxyltransferase component
LTVTTPLPAFRVGAGRGAAAEAAIRDVGGRTIGYFRLWGGEHRGALGPVEGSIIERLVHHASDLGVPIVGVVSTSGADVGQGVASLHAWGRVARSLSKASGVVPVVLVVTGPCLSGPALLLGMADLVVMTEDAYAYVSGPQAVAGFTGIDVPRDLLGGVSIHARRSGLAALVAPDEAHAFDAAISVLSYLPANNLEEPPVVWDDDPCDRDCTDAAQTVPDTPTAAYDVRRVIGDVCDRGSFLELWEAYATNMVTGLAAIGGRPVGIVANQPCQRAGTIDIEASRKAARLVQRCDAFNLPVVTFVDTPGFEPGKDLEWRGMIRHGAELVMAYAESTVPRVCIVLRKAYGGAYIVMDSKTLGNDLCVAWPNAEIAVLGAQAAVQVLHGKKLAAITDDGCAARQRTELEDDYTRAYCTPAIAAARGYVDEVIDPVDTRRIVADALHVLVSKRDHPPKRRHSNSPL